MLFKKKEKYCKMHDDLQELQFLTNCLKQAEKELNEIKKENYNIVKPFRDYIKTDYFSHRKLDILALKISYFLLWGQDYGRVPPKGFFQELKDFLPKENEGKYLKDLGKFLIACAEENEILPKKEQEIKDLKFRIEEKKKKLGIV